MDVFTETVDRKLFQKQAHFYELGIQVVRKMPARVSNTSASTAIIGRRRSVDLSASSLDLKIELSEETLEKLVVKLRNCTSTGSLIDKYTNATDV